MHNTRRGRDPVFVDRTGRRRRLFAIAGSAGGLVMILVAVALFAGFTDGGRASIPGWPAGAGHAKPGTSRPAASDGDTSAPRAGPEPTPEVTPVAAPATTPATARPTTPATSTAPTRGPGTRRHPTHTPAPHPTKSR